MTSPMGLVELEITVRCSRESRWKETMYFVLHP
jgi:hypothetical protein